MILTPESRAALERAVEEHIKHPLISLEYIKARLIDDAQKFSWTGLTLTRYGDDYPCWIDFSHQPDLLTCIAILRDFDSSPVDTVVSTAPVTCFKLLQRKVRARKMSLRKGN